MKKIPISQGKEVLVDDIDYEKLSQHKWCALKSRGTFYARRTAYQKIGKKWEVEQRILMHRELMNPVRSMQVDHIDGNGLNNQRSNLRICSQDENRWNVGKPRHNTSGFKGVCFHKLTKMWQVSLRKNSKQIYVGLYPTKEKAAEAYLEACLKYHGSFAKPV